MCSFDITDDLDPTMADKRAALHRRRYETIPEIGQLVAALPEYAGSATPEPDRTQ